MPKDKFKGYQNSHLAMESWKPEGYLYETYKNIFDYVIEKKYNKCFHASSSHSKLVIFPRNKILKNVDKLAIFFHETGYFIVHSKAGDEDVKQIDSKSQQEIEELTYKYLDEIYKEYELHRPKA